jgi:chromosome partitioning related protein ParA
MYVLSVISTKGGVGKTTVAANLGGFIAAAGLRVLLLDMDIQPTLSSYYPLTRAPAGIYELLAFNEQDTGKLVSHTDQPRLDIVISNDEKGQLNTLLLHAPDGRLRLRHLLPVFRKRRCNHTYYCDRGVAMILFPITNKEQTHENPPHTRRMAHPF